MRISLAAIALSLLAQRLVQLALVYFAWSYAPADLRLTVLMLSALIISTGKD